ncbi:hypothetical protein Rhe02_74860 [Rhizocola hellebori]|uniref:Uncharacterized protein n=1 Tax=Rhizocola hellebori TaxID=1392758 RepID=A0A8J3QEK8_9ACTN|nr:hypothetical protein [Rhizocola hellebori]GIH09419.1 hypothetical protein Rhe02_74860 [Rhizocola hellebori]
MTTNRRGAQLLMATCAALIEAIGQHMPACPYRDYVTWAFSARNPRQREFLQATGVLQLINLNTTVLSGLFEDDDWPALLLLTGRMNAYQVLEVISDNLALGLGGPALDEAAAQRRALVSSVNRAMIEALVPGRSTPAILLLAGYAQQAAQSASMFSQSLVATKHAEFARDYAHHLSSQGRPVPNPGELEFGVWPSLVANVEVCRELAGALDGTATEGLLRQGLTDRYRSVERTLFAEHLSRLELGALGAQTILVGPTLAYFLGMLLEKLKPAKAYPAAVSDGSLSEVLTDASLLVRLQNDIGTRLLQLAPVQQAAQLRRLDDSGDLFQALASNDEVMFSRLQKDVRNTESNVALWHPRRAATMAEAWTAFAESLNYYAGMYAYHSECLARGLAELDNRLGDRRASAVIERLVRFHERMYSHPHAESIGEYAI